MKRNKKLRKDLANNKIAYNKYIEKKRRILLHKVNSQSKKK